MSTAVRFENISKSYHLKPRAFRNFLSGAVLSGLSNPIKLAKGTKKGTNQSETSTKTLWALKDISFEVKHGETIGFIGRNGAGKSTLLKILSRVTKPTSGRGEVFGRVGSLLEIGTAFHPELTGRENVYLNGSILGMTRNEISRKFDEIVAFAELENQIDSPTKFYSSGQYMRLGFAVAAHLDQEILILDEVLAVGDGDFQIKCQEKMRRLSRDGRTILFVSHRMNTIEELCNKVIWLQEGRLLEFGETKSLIAKYESTFAQNDLIESGSGR